MLSTPESFVPLLAPPSHSATHQFVFRGFELLVRSDDQSLARADAFAPLTLDETQHLPVGLLGDRYCTTAWVPRDAPAPDGHSFSGLRRLFGVMDEALLGVAVRAMQIAEWARTHRHCGACGSATVRVAGERCVRCPACGHSAYPRISPAMMVLVRRGDSILLARHTASPAPRFTALAGFLEVGESIEEAIHREVFEEVGLRVRDPRYFASQSWPFPHSLMIAFTAEYAGGELRLDEAEIAEARWVGPNDPMPEIPPPVSIAHALISAHLPGRR
jgi:NAD+ diphosphatase